MVDSGRVGKRTKEALVDGLKWLVNDASLGDVPFFSSSIFGFFYFVCLSVTLLVGQVKIIIITNGWKVCSEKGS